jgi:hypothetical protein
MKTVMFAFAVITLAMPAVCLAGVPVPSTVSVPEPATALLLLAGGAGVAAYRRLRKPRG